MSALLYSKSNFVFKWLYNTVPMFSSFGLRKNMNTLPQEESVEDNKQQKLNELLQRAFDFTNRNARIPKKSNHGARPCSSVMRRLKKKYYYRRTKEAMTPEMEPKKTFDV